MQEEKVETFDFNEGFPLMVVLKATGERAQIAEYIPNHPPRFRIKGTTKELLAEDFELAEEIIPVKKFKPLAPAFKEKIKKRLKKEEAAIEAEILAIGQQKRKIAKETALMSVNHPAEKNTDHLSVQLRQQEKNCKKRLWKIVMALLRLDNDLFGICKACGGQIELARLEAIPYADTHADCKKDSRQTKKRR